MIAILNTVKNVDSIKILHNGFISKRIGKVTNFYIDIFGLLSEIDRNPKMSKKAIIFRINKAKSDNDLNDYKSALNALLKTRNNIKNINDSYLIKYKSKRITFSKQPTSIIKTLKDLNKAHKEILDFNFNEDYISNWKKYAELSKNFSSLQQILPIIFDYDNWFSKLSPTDTWGPYQLTNALSLNTCPYCNRSYTFTILKSGGNKVARPQLDHFLPQSKHPLLALSFFNLIPSCSICNSSVKGATNINYESHLSPFAKNVNHSLMRFTYYPKTYSASIGMDPNLTISLQYSGAPNNHRLKKQAIGNIDLFCLNELYANHTDIVQEIIKKRSMSGDKYIETLQKTFPSLKLTIAEAYQLAYGNYYNEDQFHRRTLAKLTKDIAIETGTLKSFP